MNVCRLRGCCRISSSPFLTEPLYCLEQQGALLFKQNKPKLSVISLSPTIGGAGGGRRRRKYDEHHMQTTQRGAPWRSVLAWSFSLSGHMETESAVSFSFCGVLASDAESPASSIAPGHNFKTQRKYFLRRPRRCAHFHVPSIQHRAWHTGTILPTGLAPAAIFLPDHTTTLGAPHGGVDP